MNLSLEDKQLLEDLCSKQGIDPRKILKLLEIEQNFEFKDRRVGIHSALREVIETFEED